MRKILALSLLLVSSIASAQTYNLFKPANGILKGQTTTYVTTPAASSDVLSLWSGTCNSSTFMRGDGSCATPAGAGTVTSVGLTVPSGFSVTGSPVTTSGTLAITGTLNVAAGGTGAATLTGVLKGNGTSALGAAASADVLGLWSGTCNSGTYLRGDGSCQAPGTGSAGGADTQVQYNNAGSFAGDAAMTFNSGTSTLTATNLAGAGSGITALNGSNVSSGTVAVTRGGTGVGTLTGLALGNGTSAFSAYAGTTCTNQFARSLNASGVATCASVALATDASGTLPVANGGTGVTTSTGSGNVVLSASPTLTGTVTAATVAATTLTGAGSGITALSGSNISSGAVPVANGGTGATATTGTGNNVLSASPTLTGTVTAATIAATTLTGAGSGITALDAGNVASGTLAVARGGTGVTSSTGSGSVVLSASPTLTGTVTAATVAATTITGAGSGITALTASNISSGTVPTARLGSGSATSSTFLRGDQTWATPSGIIPNVAYAKITWSSGSCTVISGSGVPSCTDASSGGAASGGADVGFTTSATWVCTVTSFSANYVPRISVSGGSLLNIKLADFSTGAQIFVRGDFYIMCMAN